MKSAIQSRLGFTLIELLVVVLIIGILAAVALPQYQKAVNKARAVELINVISTLDKVLPLYYSAHHSYTGADIDTLDVEIPQLKYFQYKGDSKSTRDGYPTLQVGCEGNVNLWFDVSEPIKNSGLHVHWGKNGKRARVEVFPDSYWLNYFSCQGLTQVGSCIIIP